MPRLGPPLSPLARAESPTAAFGIAVLLGIAVVLAVYPPSFIAGDAARFLSLSFAPNDAVEHVQAWRALAEHGEPWPSLWSAIFNHPEGFSIAVLDGLPLAATVFRPLLPWLPEGFHYFGWWTAFAVLMQGVAGVSLMRAAGVRHVVPCVAAALLALAMPIFVARLSISHVALSSHFLLIFAIALCVRVSTMRMVLATTFPLAAALALAALATHPQLGLQAFVFGAVAVVAAKSRWRWRILALAALCALGVAASDMLGLFAVASWQNTLALGSFGFSPIGMILGEPEALRAALDVPYAEQDAWLGWGCVLLLVAALAFRPRVRLPSSPLSWAVLALAVVAVSPWPRHGIMHIDLTALLPDVVRDLYATHRATVRLAWPAVVCLSILPLAHIWRTWPRRRVIYLLALAVLLQLCAIAPYWSVERRLARTATPTLARLPAESDLERASQLLVAQGPGGKTHGLRSMRYAHQLALDSGIPLAGGRFPRRPLADEAERFKTLQTAPDSSVRYVAPADEHAAAMPTRLPWVPVPVACSRWEAILVCRPQAESGGGAKQDRSHRIPLQAVSSFVD